MTRVPALTLLGLAILGILAARAYTEWPASTFSDAFWPGFAATVMGVALAIPAGLYVTAG